jgi:hypothetical protein
MSFPGRFYPFSLSKYFLSKNASHISLTETFVGGYNNAENAISE